MTDPTTGNAESTRVEFSRVRRAGARAMTASALVPQFTIERTVTLTRLLELRRRWKDAGRAATVSDMLTAASAHALAAHPEVNASSDGDAVMHHRAINVGLAVSLPDGLVVPCIHDADRRTLDELASERIRLDGAARDGGLTPRDVLDTTFTISNLGPLGVHRFRALVNPPQAAILAVGATVPGIVGDDEGVPQLGPVVALALSCDHRVLDGAPAARFLAAVAERLEEPDWLEDDTATRKV